MTLVLLGNAGIADSQAQTPKKQFVLVIDPGHGGKDPGAIGKKSFEKDIVLQVGLKLGRIIKKNLPSVKVIFTRETDIFIPLVERAEIANKNKADLFISIHSNSSKNKAPRGVETYLMGDAKSQENLEVAKAENAVILKENNYSKNYGGYDPNSPESFMIFSLIQNTYHRQSLHFAEYVQDQFKKKKLYDRGVKQAGLLVLWKTAMPSVLVEIGFISNTEEERFLTSALGQETLASAIYKAFRNYWEESETHTAPVVAKRVDSILLKKNLEIEDTTMLIPTDTALSEPDELINDTLPEVTDIDFMVQISSSKNRIKLPSKKFKGLKDVEEITTEEGFKYVVGRQKIYKDVMEYSKSIKNLYPGSFIIAIRNGKIISLGDALKEIKD